MEKSLFDMYQISKDLGFILYFYAFIYSFNTFTMPIKQNPDNYNENYEKQHLNEFINPFSDLVFTYANSFLYVQIWLINYIQTKILWKLEEIRQKELDEIDQTHTNIISRLNHWKNEDESNTYCEVIDHCKKGSCGCRLHHYLTAWDNLKNDIDDYFNDLKDDTNNYFDDLKDYIETAFTKLRDYTIQLFQIRLYWSFLQCVIFIKIPYLVVDVKELPKGNKKDIKKIDKALLICYFYRHHNKDIIKSKIRKVLKVSDNAVNIYLYKLRDRGFISYIKGGDKIIIMDAGKQRINYLIENYNISKYELIG